MKSAVRAGVKPQWRCAHVDGAVVEYFECGAGEPVVFLHGWGLTPRTYTDAITRLVSAGVRIIAPSLPGFGASTPLTGDLTMSAYAGRIAALLDHLDLDHPVFLMGHSLGGGVALQLASERPDLVRSLTLLNTVGGSPPPDVATTRSRRFAAMTSRPWWQWALAVAVEVDPRSVRELRPRGVHRLVVGALRDFVPSAVRHPLSMVRSARLALGADLAEVAQALIDDGVPVLFIWGDRDRLMTPGAFSAVTASLPPETVKGRHGWLLTAPEAFAELLRNALVVHAMLERLQRGQAVGAPRTASIAEFIPAERRRRTRR
ncbi:MAG TPA: alpha/beta fold hydrolase [Mycobacteriales bacterium]|nr:alpha/beta fold hydrolase [Mycobacteriales bacterium]